MLKKFLNAYWKSLAFFTLTGVIGGFFSGLYLLDSYPAEMQQQILAQGLDRTALGIVSAVQSALYGLLLGAIGIVLAKRIGLWKEKLCFEKKPLLAAAMVSLAAGLALILLDVFFFSKFSPAIAETYLVKPSIPFILASVTYGAVIEEVMMRLFLMSLIAFVLHRLFGKGREYPADAVLITANVIAALLFSAGHLPATAAMMGITPMILLRCFLLNGGIGLLFGRLYRKHGLQYAMLAHGGCHVVSKAIWLLFL